VASEREQLEPWALLTAAEREELAESYIYEDAYPMSTLQTGMVFHTQLEQFSGVYHDIVVEHVKCVWDQARFEQALRACVEEHPVLRTVFRLDGERPLQLVRRAVDLPLEVIDLREQAEAEQQVQEWLEARKRHEFDWEQGPLWQLSIFLRTGESFQFVLSFHHAVLDGWSRAVLTTELYNRYQQLLRGEEPELAPTDWTYREFIAQEQRALADDAARQYFTRLLEAAPSEQLPRLQTRATERSQGQIVVEPFTPLSARLLDLARDLGVPVQVILLAVHFKVLSTMSGHSKAVTAVIHNGRPETTGAERSLGLYLNSLPQALELADGTWRNLINEVAQLNAASMSYRGYPLSKIQQDLGWSFAEVLFNYTHFHVYSDLTTDTEQQVESLGSAAFEQTNFDLAVSVSRGLDDTMLLTLAYNGQVFDQEMIDRLGQYYVNGFESLLEGLDKPHHAKLLVTAAEQQKLLYELNDTATGYPRHSSLQELFEAQVEMWPESMALVFEKTELSYRELNQRANQLAHYLRELGVGPEVVVGLCLERSVEMIVGVLGILKAGGAYLPLDPQYPLERLRFMLEDANPAVLLTQQHLLSTIPQWSVVISLDTDWESISERSESNPPVTVTPENLAYVMYTSGSTGTPKGVSVVHRNIVRLVKETNYAQFGPDEVFLQMAPMSFDAATLELWGSLLNGAKLVVLSPDQPTLAELGAVLAQHQVTTLWLTAGLFHFFVDEGLHHLSGVRQLLAGGDVLSPKHVQQVVAGLSEGQRLINGYGPTEGTTFSCCYVMDQHSEIGANVPIGGPVANTTVYVLDQNYQSVPLGAIGELYLGGDGLARGYLKRPELTAEKFIPHPFSTDAGARLYRTGDSVRYLPNGALEFLGRLDQQVKLRGFRIELEEIQHQLTALPGINTAVVIARQDEPGDKKLVAYVTLAENGQEDHDEIVAGLRHHLQSKLPDYMVPSAFVILEEFPLTANGKLDRRALPAPGYTSPSGEYVKPVTETETALTEIWAQLLKVDPNAISARANLFELGGHSLMLIRLVTEIRNRFAVELSIKDVMERPQLNLLAERILEANLKNALSVGSQYEVGADEMEITI
jgi:amino acid adenylation domain-containing protein